MTERRKAIIASSIEPSGVTWLLNCLLYLDILCYRGGTPVSTWNLNEDGFSLRSDHEELKRWLPITSDQATFKFSSQVECEWTHDLPNRDLIADKVILFTRDPRGSILSRYKRDFRDIPIEDFIRLLDPETLLAVPDQLNHFYLSWLNQLNVLVIRFEDYKLNPVETLKKATTYLGLSYCHEKLNSACINSTFEKAVAAETKYLEKYHLSPERMMNRAGSAHEWGEDTDLSSVRDIIEKACYTSSIKLNYLQNAASIDSGDNRFSHLCLRSIRISDVLFQSHYTKESKVKIIQGISNLPTLGLKKCVFFTLISKVLNQMLVLEEKMKVQYLKIKIS